jgi:hypothetical protein
MLANYFKLLGVLLAVILPLYYWFKWQCRTLYRCAPERSWTGNGIDVSPVSNRLQQLREDYPATIKLQPNTDKHTRLANARETIKHLSFFQKPTMHEPLDKDHEGRYFVF